MNDPMTARIARTLGCRACVFFRSPAPDRRTGTCHVNPPRTSTARWPVVDGDEHCGEWVALDPQADLDAEAEYLYAHHGSDLQ